MNPSDAHLRSSDVTKRRRSSREQLLKWAEAYDGRNRSALPTEDFDLIKGAADCADRLSSLVIFTQTGSDRWIAAQLRCLVLELDEVVARICHFGWPNDDVVTQWAVQLGCHDFASTISGRNYRTWMEHSIDVAAYIRHDFVMVFDRSRFDCVGKYDCKLIVDPTTKVTIELAKQFVAWVEKMELYRRASDLPELVKMEAARLERRGSTTPTFNRTIDVLEQETPPLDVLSENWVSARAYSEIWENAPCIDSLRQLRSKGRKHSAGVFGVDTPRGDGRRWRKEDIKSHRVYYFVPDLGPVSSTVR
ncbi:MAG: hypothetical protein R3C10_18830 [Pirellulales bacterium]